MATVLYNGQLLTDGALQLSAGNRGFFYGDGFFETIRLFNGQPLWLDDHLDRMSRTFTFLHLPPPFPLLKSHLQEVILTTAEANGIASGGRVRITFFRESAGFYTPAEDRCSFLVQCHRLENNLYELNKKGLHLTLYNQNLKPAVTLSSLKTLNALIYVLAGIYARNQGCDDALIMNDYENIIESTNANLFVVKNETIYTPGLDEGCVSGVMRGNILKIIENHTEYQLQRGNLRLREIVDADEVFLTNTIRGISWVVGFREKRYYNRVSTHLMALLNRQISG
jgi:aminodeoxychorismate lyase